MIDLAAHLDIERLGQRGEGIARGKHGPVFVPYALAGETILAEIDGERGRLVEVLKPSPERIAAFCAYYGICGGCAVQTLTAPAYAAWKRGLLVQALQHTKIDAAVADLVDAHGEGRRRASFHVRYDNAPYADRGKTKVGFMQARAHDIVDLDACPILAPTMTGAIAAARAIAAALQASQKPLDVVVTATLSGLDIDIRGHGPLDDAATQRLIRSAEACDLARLSNHGERVIERRIPFLNMGRAAVTPPPGAFLQATEAGEMALAAHVGAALAGSRRIADLFAGIGTFTLRLAEHARVHAVDFEEGSLTALAKAARAAPHLQQVTTERRDLFRSPLDAETLAPFDALVFDPPRAGAEAQAKILAKSALRLVVAVSCNVQSFARDAAILCAGGYEIESITPFDQFRHSPHVEIIGIFRRPGGKGRRRRLLG
jgi:23S rRNA (uracil1939-C5)-methyltransferase